MLDDPQLLVASLTWVRPSTTTTEPLFYQSDPVARVAPQGTQHP